MYEYTAYIAQVHDGDTITVDIDLGFNVLLKDTKLRLNGLNCPELSTPAGKEVAAFAKNMLQPNLKIVVQTIKDKQEKYGRYLATVFLADGTNFNELLLSSGRAKPWDGKGARPT